MTNPFRLDPPAVVSFSGGRTSGYMLWRVLEAHGGTLPADVRVVFCNTGKERPETLEFVERCSAEWGVDITWLEYRRVEDKHTFAIVDYATASRAGEPFEALIRAKSYLPNMVARFCTQELKIRLLEKWCNGMGWEDWTTAVGIRADEPQRLAKGKANAERQGYEVVHPLGAAGVTLADVMAFWAAQPFDLGLQPHEGNCDLCFLKGKGRLLRILADRPDLADWWARMETLVPRADGGTGRFRRDRPGYVTLKALAQQPTLFDMADGADELDIACHCTD